ncbi:MAG TPA: Y-family DNA polymerase [Ktedonobacteraceae bacterium]|nr:Y-family DNA polymerase [Ktedonobacteraceae bacterium]
MHQVVALIDCNNFYCSCERAFNAALHNRPVLVLSNNDGCVVARSNEAKALGVKMGQPVFECRELIEQHEIQVFSSNYSLYADMSDRVMKTLAIFTPHLEVYSIDEAFADLSHIPRERLCEYGHEIREAVWRCTGIPVSVGIATTKTLSKIATEIVKKNPCHQDVLSLTQYTKEELDELLASTVLKDVWGIGSRYTHRLQASRSIFTAKDLKDADEHWIRKRFSVTVQRSVLELRGIACIPLETEPKPKKGIMTAKSFGRPVESLAELEEAVATYTARAVEKLRSQESAASCIGVFITTNPFQQNAPQYANSLSRLLPFQSAFTPDFLNVALDMVRSLYQPGFSYKKAGVFLSKIVSQEVLQADLFGDYSLERQYTKARLMAMVDFINQWWGHNTIFFGAQGIGREWKMRQERRSSRFTTQWGEILVVST